MYDVTISIIIIKHLKFPYIPNLKKIYEMKCFDYLIIIDKIYSDPMLKIKTVASEVDSAKQLIPLGNQLKFENSDVKSR
jgi:hypothetical protein